LLSLYGFLSLSASLQKGLSFDEGEELAVGYGIWRRHDFRMEGANGDFVKRWATLPFILFSHPTLPPRHSENWRRADPYTMGYEFFFQSGNSPDFLLLQSRAMMVMLGMATGFLVFWCSRELFGAAGGLISLVLFVFSPNMLAFGALASTAMPVCLGFLGTTWSVWRLLHRVTWGRVAASLGFFCLLTLAKPSVLVMIPITAVLVTIKLISGRPLEWRFGRRSGAITSRSVQVWIFCAAAILHAIAGWGALWAHYEFRYAASPDPNDKGLLVWGPLAHPDPISPTAARLVAWSRRTHFLPEGFLNGIERLLGKNDERQAFMHGRWRTGGWRLFFPYAIWLKTSPPFLLLLAGALAGWLLRRRRDPSAPAAQGEAAGAPRALAFSNALPFVVLIVVFMGFAIAQDLNIGHRHIVPIYPSLHILAGATAMLWIACKKWIRIAIAGLLAWFVVDASSARPHYLAYFTPFIGGSQQGYKYLVDSSLDWGMDLPGLKHWLLENNPRNRDEVSLAYFGTDSPEFRQIKCYRLPSFFDWRPEGLYALKPGIYAISATLFESVYTTTFGPWNREFEAAYQNCRSNLEVLDQTAHDSKLRAQLLAQSPAGFWENEYKVYERYRFARLCAWLRHNRPPAAQVGHTILIWRLNDEDLYKALSGPPAELEAGPVRN